MGAYILNDEMICPLCFCEREREERENMGIIVGGGDKNISKLPLVSLNHVSFVCNSVTESVRFYEDVLGFVLIKRPASFNFEGAWYTYTYIYICTYI